VLKWLREQGCPSNELACCNAASNGHLEVLKWLRDNECFDADACMTTRHKHVLEWLREIGVLREGERGQRAVTVSTNGQVEVWEG